MNKNQDQINIYSTQNESRGSIVAQWIKLQLWNQHLILPPVHVLDTPLLILLPTNGPGKEVKDSPTIWITTTFVRDVGEAPSS